MSNRPSCKPLPDAIRDFGDLFVEMQHKRHTADYNPDAQFTKSDVVKDIDRVGNVIRRFNAVAAARRRAFAIHVLLDQRKS